MLVERHLDFVQQRMEALVRQLGIDVAAGDFHRRAGMQRQGRFCEQSPAVRRESLQRELVREVAVEFRAQRARFIGRYVEAGAGHQQQPVAVGAQVHRVGAQPVAARRFRAEGERRKRAGGKGRFPRPERAAIPGLKRKRIGVRAAPAGQQEFQRGHGGLRVEQRRHDELEVH